MAIPYESFVVRLPIGMRQRLKIASKITSRSMNSELILALEAHLKTIEQSKGSR